MKLMSANTVYVGRWVREPGTRDPEDKGEKEVKAFHQLEVFESSDWMDDEEAEKLIEMGAAIPAPKDGEPIHLPGMKVSNSQAYQIPQKVAQYGR